MALDGEAIFLFLVNVPCIALLDQNSIFSERVPATLLFYNRGLCERALCVPPLFALSFFVGVPSSDFI